MQLALYVSRVSLRRYRGMSSRCWRLHARAAEDARDRRRSGEARCRPSAAPSTSSSRRRPTTARSAQLRPRHHGDRRHGAAAHRPHGERSGRRQGAEISRRASCTTTAASTRKAAATRTTKRRCRSSAFKEANKDGRYDELLADAEKFVKAAAVGRGRRARNFQHELRRRRLRLARAARPVEHQFPGRRAARRRPRRR